MGGMHVKFNIAPEDFVADITDAAYRVALKYGFKGSFLDFELDLHTALHETIGKEMEVSNQCGTAQCRKALHCAPWSEEAKKLLKS